jgi:hypothetical protein
VPHRKTTLGTEYDNHFINHKRNELNCCLITKWDNNKLSAQLGFYQNGELLPGVILIGKKYPKMGEFTPIVPITISTSTP